MSDFLAQMAAASRARAGDARAGNGFAQLRARASSAAPPPALRRHARFDLIAEIKQRSPAAGPLGNGDVGARAAAYAEAGAAAVSVLTEPTQFGGELRHLRLAAEALAPLGVPAMRKDFVVDPVQVLETRAAGGGGVLLVARMLSDGQLRELVDCAGEFGLFVLLEAFDLEDLERIGREVSRAAVAEAPAQVLVGVNCRDLRTLAVQPQRFAELAARLPRDAGRVAESGIGSSDDCARARQAGYDVALVGTALMRSTDPRTTIRGMLDAGRSA